MKMNIILGKQWLEKTKYYMKESLKQNQAIWIVRPEMKMIYEKMLLELSDTKSLLMHSVMTFSELFDQECSKAHLFNVKTINKTTALIWIYDLLRANPESFFSYKDIGTLEELWNLFITFNSQQVSLENIEDKTIPSFSKTKVKACFDLYQQFMHRLKKHHLVMPEDYSILEKVSDQPYYIDTFDHFSHQEMTFIKKMKDVTILLTYDKTPSFLLKNFDVFNETKFNTAVSSYRHYLEKYFQDLKAMSYNDSHPFYYAKALNKEVEIHRVASLIYDTIASGKARYQDIVVYSKEGQLIQNIFKKHGLRVNLTTPIEAHYKEVYLFIKSLFDYLLEEKDTSIMMILKSQCLNVPISNKMIDSFQKQLFTTGTCLDENFIAVKLALQYLKKQCLEAKTSHDLITILHTFFTNQEVTSRNIVERYNDWQSLFSELELFDEEIDISLEDFILLFMREWKCVEKKEAVYQDAIDVCLNTVIDPSKKIYFILDCVEGSFPMIERDHGLLLNEDCMAFEKVGIDLGMNLYEKIEQDTLAWYKLFYLEKEMHLSYANGSLSGEDALPSSLFLTLQRLFKSEEDIWNEKVDTQWMTTKEVAYDLLVKEETQDPYLIKSQDIVHQYVQTKNQPILHHVDNYVKLLEKNGQKLTSPSELETYNGCPFKYYLRYGLKLYPWKDASLKANDFGSFVHDVLDRLSDVLNMEKTIDEVCAQYHLQDIEKIYETKIYPDICLHTTLSHEDQALFVLIYTIACEKIDTSKFNASGWYLFNKIIYDVFNTVKVLMYQRSISLFEITDHEAWVEKAHQDVRVQGRFDRQDQYQQYVKVVDYKSSNKALDLCLASLGFNMQMLLYLDMICDRENLERGGVLYFNTKQRVVKLDEYLNEKPLALDELLKLYKMEGFVLNDENVLKAIDTQYDPSVIASFKYVKSKKSYSGNVLDKEMFKALLDKVNERVDTIIDEIYHQGNILILPSGHSQPNINMLVDPCTYCDYSSICLKDVFYNDYREIEYQDKATMMKVLRGEEDDQSV